MKESQSSSGAGAPGRARVLALAKYGPRAASTRQRLLQYAPVLARAGIDLDLHPLLDDAYLGALMDGRPRSRIAILRSYARRLGELIKRSDHDAIWVQYELFPFLPLLDRLLLRTLSRPIVYDIDDAIFHMYDQHRSGPVRRLMGGKLRPLMRHAAVCLCGNAYLADYVERAGGRARVVPTVVDTQVFRPARAAPADDRLLTFGWIGSPSTWAYVAPLLPTLLPVMARLGARFLVVGAGPAAQGIDGIDALEWSEAREVADIQTMDVGLMPVPDEAWAQGKCGYKLIQYMACGVPGIASPVGVNRTIIDHGRDGLLARAPADWIAALEQLAEAPALRRAMGAAGRERVVASYSLASQQPAVLAAFAETLGRRA